MMKWPPPPTPLYIGVYNESNPYNYWLNLNHPDVQAAYKAYCAGIGHRRAIRCQIGSDGTLKSVSCSGAESGRICRNG